VYTKHSVLWLALLAALMFPALTLSGQSAPASSGPAVLERVELTQESGQAVVRIVAKGELVVHALRLTNPERLALDFAGTRRGPIPPAVVGAVSPVRGIRVGQFKPDVARVVVDLKAPAPYQLQTSESSVTIIFWTAGASAEALPALPHENKKLTDLTNVLPAKRVPSVIVTEAVPPDITPPPLPASTLVPPTIASTASFSPNSFESGLPPLRLPDQPLRSIAGTIGDLAHVPLVVADDVGSEHVATESLSVRLDLASPQTLKNHDAPFSCGRNAIQSDTNLSASDDTFAPFSPNGVGLPGGFDGTAGSDTFYNSSLDCEHQVSVPGYLARTKTLSDPADVAGISVTSLLVPSSARNEFEKANNDIRISNNHLASAERHLEKAIARYDKYAAAWNQLGTIYLIIGETDKATQAFAKAIAGDPQSVPAYVRLAALQLQTGQYESAIETAGKALQLDPRADNAKLVEAAANLKLNRLDSAEKIAQDAEKQPHQTIPQLHILLVEIYLQKRDVSNAAAEMRAYLKESPQGPFADSVRNDLARIGQSAADGHSKPEATAAQAKNAP
jgi:Flp pilus assembly protein TadD